MSAHPFAVFNPKSGRASTVFAEDAMTAASLAVAGWIRVGSVDFGERVEVRVGRDGEPDMEGWVELRLSASLRRARRAPTHDPSLPAHDAPEAHPNEGDA